MILHININAKWLENDKDAIDRLVNENMNWKLDQYLQKFEWDDKVCDLKLTLKKNKKSLFNGILQVIVDWKIFRYEREDYKKLDDLINHFFDHFKEELANS
ncbi:MAG: hypothetical protein ACD_4C00478G0001 [uncultured bacterium (gcode 4)]|uniref:Uncharacterized protein n=1 Tax=uncultured bacterium (gcode 4) TaxID=1234023 RepID=K2FSY4_9BACT|nr:MAG: hypothetical protein ACD_4C00478G0001 [uncultured bacterium (gcode 4)]